MRRKMSIRHRKCQYDHAIGSQDCVSCSEPPQGTVEASRTKAKTFWWHPTISCLICCPLRINPPCCSRPLAGIAWQLERRNTGEFASAADRIPLRGQMRRNMGSGMRPEQGTSAHLPQPIRGLDRCSAGAESRHLRPELRTGKPRVLLELLLMMSLPSLKSDPMPPS